MGRDMAKLKLKYVNEYIDRTGKLRRYFRKNGKQLGPLPGDVGSEEFMTTYAAYMAEKPAQQLGCSMRTRCISWLWTSTAAGCLPT